MSIRTVRAEELAALRGIERRAGAAFAEIGMEEVSADEPPSIETLASYQREGRAWAHVDDADQPVAYLIAEVVDGAVHIEQVSVDPVAAGRGIGRGLIDHVASWASDQGYRRLTLTTFADVAWNAPYYRRLGFEVIATDDMTTGLAQIRAEEAAIGLDRWPRVAMTRPTGRRDGDPAVTIDDDVRRRLMDAGGAAVRFNAPLGRARVGEIASFVGANATTVVDLGCGSGALTIELAERQPALVCAGLDSNPGIIERAQAAASRSSAADRLRFVVGDASTDAAPADAAVCIGSSHAFGEPAEALAAMLAIGTSIAVVGEGIWTASPDQAIREIFGDLPDGEAGLVELAESVGWTVAGHGRSSLEEWDEFELAWIGGVRSVGTPEAIAFADERLEEYRSYRGVLGFGWLFLTR